MYINSIVFSSVLFSAIECNAIQLSSILIKPARFSNAADKWCSMLFVIRFIEIQTRCYTTQMSEVGIHVNSSVIIWIDLLAFASNFFSCALLCINLYWFVLIRIIKNLVYYIVIICINWCQLYESTIYIMLCYFIMLCINVYYL